MPGNFEICEKRKIIGSKKSGIFHKCPVFVQGRNPQDVKKGNSMRIKGLRK
jgi:hypothetical protein